MPGPLAEGLDARSSVFRDLTLLEVGDSDPDWDQTALEPSADSDPRILSFICALPRLTHLGLYSTLSSATLRTLLNGCHKLQLLVFTLSSTMQEAYSSIEWATTLPIRDPRIVVSVWRDWPECVDWDGPT
uniref:F-box domain-containing protein n=1 Tax=Mycena chlorophos TaxID=658473 RepID=A0ABQ0L660_MYCCL|nr:predicted protein [Mycena chlorophos]